MQLLQTVIWHVSQFAQFVDQKYLYLTNNVILYICNCKCLYAYSGFTQYLGNIYIALLSPFFLYNKNIFAPPILYFAVLNFKGKVLHVMVQLFCSFLCCSSQGFLQRNLGYLARPIQNLAFAALELKFPKEFNNWTFDMQTSLGTQQCTYILTQNLSFYSQSTRLWLLVLTMLARQQSSTSCWWMRWFTQVLPLAVMLKKWCGITFTS